MESTTLPRGYCLACGYALQGLTAASAGYLCPECGRMFDPTNAKTFSNVPHGRLIRWLATPVEWAVVSVGLAAAAGVMSVSRWKWGTFAPSTVDVVYYLRPSALRHRTSLETGCDYIYTMSMLAAIFALGWWVMRWGAGVIVRRRTGIQQNEKPIHTGRRHALLAIALLITAGGATLGWPYRLGQQWAARQLAANKTPVPQRYRYVPIGATPPTAMSPDQTQATLRAALILLPQVEQRMAGLKLLIEGHPEMSLPMLAEAVKLETDSELRVAELRLIGMRRHVDTAELLMQFMTHPDVHARAAAADALGILHRPAFEIPLPGDRFNPTAGYPIGRTSINLSGLVAMHLDDPRRWPGSLRMMAFSLDANVHDALGRMMVNAASTEEREAAARALLAWPPKQYELRVAEWGVWINDTGELKLVQSILDEIPNFVHRTGNPLAEFNSRVNPIIMVTKPVIHITVTQPMAVDVNVVINCGRPYYAYPRPDDFAVGVDPPYSWPNESSPPMTPLDNPAVPKLPDLRQGYPWLEPHHSSAGSLSGGMGSVNALTGLGLNWQSLIVSPTQLPWMAPPDCGTDPRYTWWTRLRQVPSSWVTSRGESERFLYYDGPTLAKAPVSAALTENMLRLTSQYDLRFNGHEPPPQAGLLIHRHDGLLSGQAIAMLPVWNTDHLIFDQPLHEDPLRQDQVIDTFRGMLKSAGLTAEEGEGLVASWQPQFFQTDGTRLLLIMSRADYDRICPIEVRPPPTEMERVGILLTEFR